MLGQQGLQFATEAGKTACLNLHQHLTPQEIKVASFIKEGRSTKEIADILRITSNAVDYHRKNIRKKLGLSGKSVNLQSFLMSIAES